MRLAAQAVDATRVEEVVRTQFPAVLEALAAEIAALGRAADAPAVAGRIPESWRVVDSDERVDVSARWLIAALVSAPAEPAAWPATRTALVRRLHGVGDEIESGGGANRARSRAQARAAVETILAGSEFQQSAASRWRERLQEQVGQWFEDLLGRFGAGRGAARDTALVFAWAAALAALIGLGYWLARTIAEHPRSPLSLGSVAAQRPRARDLALRALAAARLGQTRDAVRCAYGAALVRLEEQGVWHIDDARTPREYLPLLSPTDSRHPAILDLTRRFEQIWYGNRVAADDDARRVTDHLEALGCLRPGERAI